MKYNFELTGDEINVIINALATRPYGEVYMIINSISEQIKNNSQSQKESNQNNNTKSE